MIKVGLITYYFIFLLANSNKPPIRKLKKTVRWVLGIILSLYIGTILLLNIPYVQRQISVLVANELANVLGTQLTIGRINMGLLIMAKKAKGNRVQVILECTEHKDSGMPGTSRYITTKNRKNTTERLELKKYNPILKRVTVHKEIK